MSTGRESLAAPAVAVGIPTISDAPILDFKDNDGMVNYIRWRCWLEQEQGLDLLFPGRLDSDKASSYTDGLDSSTGSNSATT